MKTRTVLFLLAFLTTCQFAFAQQAAAPRIPAANEQLDLQKGELEHFKNMLFRFETAIEEQDQESTDELKQVLLDLISKDLVSSKNAGDPFSKKLPGIRKAVAEYKFPVDAFGGEEFKKKLALFREIEDWKAGKIAALENTK